MDNPGGKVPLTEGQVSGRTADPGVSPAFGRGAPGSGAPPGDQAHLRGLWANGSLDLGQKGPTRGAGQGSPHFQGAARRESLPWRPGEEALTVARKREGETGGG